MMPKWVERQARKKVSEVGLLARKKITQHKVDFFSTNQIKEHITRIPLSPFIDYDFRNRKSENLYWSSNLHFWLVGLTGWLSCFRQAQNKNWFAHIHGFHKRFILHRPVIPKLTHTHICVQHTV